VSFRSDYRLSEDQVIAIEPFSTDGAGSVKDTEDVFIFSLLGEKPVRNMDARKIIELMIERNGLPFAERWLPMTPFKARMALRELGQRGLLHEHNVLKESGGGMVAQAEHTIIVRDNPVIITA
ncbi:type II methionyl aminopeptidase, partial [Candidatus Woesearchaeota archaeon]|nr:type II methionyl aminopeptidase [Candidatus Woesearchaeota archaeon]